MTMTTRLSLCSLTGALGAAILASSIQAAEPTKPAQRTFASAQEAADALVAAAEKFDTAALKELFGPDGVDVVVTEDTVQDKNQAAAFAAEARKKLVVTIDPANPNSASMSVGPDGWPSPIPLLKDGNGWRFDVEAGREEIFLRRIGQNELDAIAACRSYVRAQHEYAQSKHDGARVNQYAQHIISTSGKQDGLVWRKPDGTLEGPIADHIARAIAEGYTDKTEPYHGYYFKVLTGQGPSAPLGELDFVVQGAMIGGFALVAAPADYEKTGVKSFIVSHDGIVYEKDLGPKTLESFKAMKRFDPDESWNPVEEH
jgi:hypothetical protein